MSSRPVEQALPDLRVDLERYIAAVEGDDLALEVDGRLVRLHQRPHVLLRQRDRQHADLGAVGVEDVGEARRDDRPEAEVLERPDGVLARGAAAEVAAGDEDRAARARARAPPGASRRTGTRRSRVRSIRFRNCFGMIWSVSTSARSSTWIRALDLLHWLHQPSPFCAAEDREPRQLEVHVHLLEPDLAQPFALGLGVAQDVVVGRVVVGAHDLLGRPRDARARARPRSSARGRTRRTAPRRARRSRRAPSSGRCRPARAARTPPRRARCLRSSGR